MPRPPLGDDFASISAGMQLSATWLGTIVAFDALRGLGSVALARGNGVVVAFHCMAIDDGTREIEVGVRVAGTLAPDAVGRLQMARITKL